MLWDFGVKLLFGECVSKFDWFVGVGVRNKCFILFYYGICGFLFKMVGFSFLLWIFCWFFCMLFWYFRIKIYFMFYCLYN